MRERPPSLPLPHPLSATLRRGRLRCHHGRNLGACHGLPVDDGWTSTSELCRDDQVLHGRLEALGHAVGTVRVDVQASLLVEAYAWTLVLPVAGAVVAESRSPDLSPDRVALRFGPAGRPADVAFLGANWSALREDDEAGHPDAAVFPDDETLTSHVHDDLFGHLHPLIVTLRRLSGRGANALWRGVADRTAAAFLWAGEATSKGDRAERLATALLDGPGPLHGRPRYATVEDRGAPRRVHLRAGCCLWWRTPAATTCLTCPLERRPDRGPRRPAGAP